MVAPYAECGEDEECIDSACQRGIGSLANAIFTKAGNVSSVKFHNSLSRIRELRTGRKVVRQIWLKARKNIQDGEEIFHHYGNEYKLENTHSTGRRKKVPDSRPC